MPRVDYRTHRSTDAKDYGAFYTAPEIADFLVWWGIRSGADTVLDPGFGQGVFLRSASERLILLGGNPGVQVFGVEVDPKTYKEVAGQLRVAYGVKKSNLFRGSFFGVEKVTSKKVNVVVGNPPFIRYQRFSGDVRQRGLTRAAQQGVYLSGLSSSWAPFLVYAVAMLAQGGRLAMVVPAELCHASYAVPVLKYLAESFGKVTFLTFGRTLFPHLSQDTLLLLAEGKGSTPPAFLLRDLPDQGALGAIRRRDHLPLYGTRRMREHDLANGCERLIEYLITRAAQELYRELRSHPETHRLGELADVGIGYVTGANRYFHLNPHDLQSRRIPKSFLKPAVRRGRALSGLRFTKQDWREASSAGEAGYLLHISSDRDLPDSVKDYLELGERQGIPKAYKCRTREPWFRVPHVYESDAFLTYMSGKSPRVVSNDAGAVATNSLHILRILPSVKLTSHGIAALWQTSLTRLSSEIEGHSLGGGLLKLEPTEAESTMLGVPALEDSELVELARELDALIRRGEDTSAQMRADYVVLRRGLGLSENDCRHLRLAADTLRERRYSRGRSV